MVVHDPLQTENLVQNRLASEQITKKIQSRKKSRSAWAVIGIQSLACAVLLLLVVLFRLMGGNSYEGLRQGFHRALERNELMTVISRLWDEDPFYDLEYTDEGSVKEKNFTGSNP